MAFLRLIGDSHQLHNEYLKLTKGCEYTIQVGDCGYNLEGLQGKLRVGNDFVLGGNHETYDKDSPNYILGQPWSLDHYGVLEIPDFEPIFYMRGEWSIDWKWRLRQQTWPNNGPTTWFPDEELNAEQLMGAIALYNKVKPNFVVTHGCPKSVVKYVTDPNFCLNFGYTQDEINTRTSVALQTMFEIHQPHFWTFGHYHCDKQFEVNGTAFTCLDMLYENRLNTQSYINFEKRQGII